MIFYQYTNKQTSPGNQKGNFEDVIQGLPGYIQELGQCGWTMVVLRIM